VLPTAVAMRRVVLRVGSGAAESGEDEETRESAAQDLATTLTLAFQVWQVRIFIYIHRGYIYMYYRERERERERETDLAIFLTLACEVWQETSAAQWGAGRERDTAAVLRGYVALLKDTVGEWLAWESGAVCLMAAASAAALHAPVRDEFLRSNVEPQLAACAARTGLAAVNVEALAADASRIYKCPQTYAIYVSSYILVLYR
jgi:hypothetical protein